MTNASAFVKGKQVLVALVNGGEASRIRRVRIAGVRPAIAPVRARVFADETIEDRTVEMIDSRTFSVQMPARGVATVLLESGSETNP